MLDTNSTVNGNSQYYTTPIKDNHSDTVPIAQFILGSDTLQCQHNITTHMTHQKLNQYGKEYLCFQIDGGTSLSEQCYKSRALSKIIEFF